MMKEETLILTLFCLGSLAKTILDPNDYRNYADITSINALEDMYLKNSTQNLAEDPNLQRVEYLLYVFGKGTPLRFNFDTDPQELVDYGFDIHKKTKFVAHGWVVDGEDFASPFGTAFNYYEPESINVIGIDWDALAPITNYLSSAYYSNAVGQYVGEKIVVNMLIESLGQTPSQIEAVGHSLGAHLVGHLGRSVYSLTGQKISRVTGLDPAKPFFDLVSIDYRIQPTDAELVDVIHTNSGELWDAAVSFPDPLGQVDFYPNGGSHQKGCTDLCEGLHMGFACIGFDLIDFFLAACSHRRAHHIYVESIYRRGNSPMAFKSTGCDSYEHYEAGSCDLNTVVPMGEGFSSSMLSEAGNSLFYLDTNAENPFSMT